MLYTWPLFIFLSLLTPPAGPQNAPSDAGRGPAWTRFEVHFVSAADLASQLHLLPRYAMGSPVTFQAVAANNTIVASGPDDDLRTLQQAIRLMDVAPKRLAIHASLVLRVRDRAGRVYPVCVDATGYTVHDRGITLKTDVDRTAVSRAGLTLSAGHYDVRVHPRVLGNGDITLDADWNVDLTLRGRDQAEPVHLQASCSGSQRSRNNRAVPLSTRTLQIGRSRRPALRVEVRLLLTPTIVRTEASSR